MKRSITTILAGIASAALLATGVPAQADTQTDNGITLSTDDVVYRSDNCFHSHYTVSGLDPAQSYTLDFYAPDGAVQDFDFFYDQASGAGDTLLCEGFDPVGRYTAKLVAEEDGSTVVVSHFRVSKPRKPAKADSHLSVHRTKRHRHAWLIRGHLTREGKAWRDRPVFVQARVLGEWHKVSPRKRTNRHGNVRFVSHPKRGAGKVRVRLHAPGTRHTKPANSRTFRLPHRG